MPNHIQNRLQFIGDNKEVQKVLNHIKGKYDDGKEMQIDFNKIKPMPKELNIETHSGVEMWAEICTGQIDFASLFQPMETSASEMFKNGKYGTLASRMSAGTAMEHLTGKRKGNVKDLSEADFNMFIQCLKNYRKHGFISWFEWSKSNWGTKWNAYDQNDKRNTADTIYFQTACSAPLELMQELSKMFPLVKIAFAYADEDSGSNAGKIIFENGEATEVNQPEGQSKDAYDIYFELHPDRINDYKLVGDKYETTVENRLSLKWGTLKSWHFDGEQGQKLMKEYNEIGSSFSAMDQQDTPRQKEIICELIDLCDGDTIYLEWDGKDVPKQEAKEYVMNYGKK